QINLSNAVCSICHRVGHNRVACRRQGSGNNSGEIRNNGVRVKIENNKNEVPWNSHKIIRNILVCHHCSKMSHNRRSCLHRRRNEHTIPEAQLNEILKGIKKFKDSPKYRMK
ncbi:39997_t:CDS:2, partial [Gigaspora margarita]